MFRRLVNQEKNYPPRLLAFVIAVKDKERGQNNYEKFKRNYTDYIHKADVAFENEDSFAIAGHDIHCIYTPGHSLGNSIYVLDENFVFTGDSLILSNKVITRFKDGDADEFRNNTLPILQSFPSDITIMPGHGEPFKKKDFKFNIYNNV